MPSFPGVDYLRIDSLFNEQELFVRQTARQFVDDRAVPLMRDCFREARFPS
jgi:glutaryl-CoA dehydrogenase